MVGHSGDLQATIKAIEYLDHELKHLYDKVITHMNGTVFITADHGNAEEKWDSKANQPKTSHTTNPVPFIMIRNYLENSPMQLPVTTLSEIAPFILKTMGITIPKEMFHSESI